MRTTHRVVVGDARRLDVPDASVHLVVTSPPYPMIAMWDAAFAALDPAVPRLLETDPAAAFEAQHAVLDAVWAECRRVLVPGGFLCVNVGDATRSLGPFRLWSNHARVLTACERLGFTTLPDILWRKPTNAPNKFMGSGMLPGGAYVTYEHEYVLVFRSGGPRAFDAAEKRLRRESAYFWEERNLWFSDLWSGLTGTDQGLPSGAPRERSGAFPLDLPWRLVHMYALYGDVVLDPFAGTGTTALAAACAGRSSVSIEREAALADGVYARIAEAPRLRRAEGRLAAHQRFVDERLTAGRAFTHYNTPHAVPVVTGQEVDLTLWEAVGATLADGRVDVEHEVFGADPARRIFGG
ncbi:MAG: DNA-methyltransferase, partial [Myxococcota bacterium]